MMLGTIALILVVALAAGARALDRYRTRKTALKRDAKVQARALVERAEKALGAPHGGPVACACVQNVRLLARRQHMSLAELGTGTQELNDLMRRGLMAPGDRLGMKPAKSSGRPAIVVDRQETRREIPPSPAQSGGRNFYPVLDLDKGEPALEIELVRPAKRTGR